MLRALTVAVLLATKTASANLLNQNHDSLLAATLPSVAENAAPTFQNPFATVPPLVRPAGASCEVVLFQNEAQNSYGDYAEANFDTSKCLSGGRTYKSAVLDLHGEVTAGIQFDRFGALWIGQLEVLRLTTPEPSNEINWTVERDLTSSLSYLVTGNRKAHLTIPNVVNPTYTGQIFINASVTFYEEAPAAGAPEPADAVVGITGDTSKAGLLDSIGKANVTYSFSAPGSDFTRAELRVFASGHGCEEFWYGNVPDPAPKGQCGGGAFRAIEVLIDGQVAGLAFPFPVLYTGGENPLLWHPLTGIMSFDVVPYAFDVTPFVATLNDGKAHTLEIRVLHEQSTGVWYTDAALLLWRDGATAAVTGGIVSHSSPPPNVQTSTAKNADGSTTITTTGLAQLTVAGRTCIGSTCTVTSVQTALFSRNSNTESSARQRTVFALIAKTIVNTTDEKTGALVLQRVSQHQYPMDMSLYSPQVKGRTVIQANITFARGRTESWRKQGSGTLVVSWQNAMNGSAILNHTNTTPRKYGPEGSSTNSSMSVVLSEVATDPPCYSFSLSARDGVVVGGASASSLKPVSSSCTRLPAGTRFCGIELCGEPFIASFPTLGDRAELE